MFDESVYYENPYEKEYEEEKVECRCCHEKFDEDELNSYGLCDECCKYLVESMTLEDTIEYAKTDKYNDSLFVLLTEYIFSKEQVKEMLLKEARKLDEKVYKKELVDFLMNDDYDLFDYLDKKGEI